jgi:hypothetical protein
MLLEEFVVTALILRGKHNIFEFQKCQIPVVTALILRGKHNFFEVIIT